MVGDVERGLKGQREDAREDVLPKLSRMAALVNAKNPNVNYWEELATAAKKLGLSLDRMEVREPGDLENAFAAVARNAAGAVLV